MRAAILRIRKLILMNRDADCILRCVENFEPIVHIGAFLICNSFNTCVMNGAICVARNLYLEAGDFEQSAKIQQNIQVDAFFWNAVC